MVILPDQVPVDRLRWMSERLTELIAAADEQQNTLLAALLSEAQDAVLAEHSGLPPPS